MIAAMFATLVMVVKQNLKMVLESYMTSLCSNSLISSSFNTWGV